MSEITDNNIGDAGDATAAADMNTKFTDVEVSSQSINEENVRSEGIDRRTLGAHGYPVGRQQPLVYIAQVANGVTSSTKYGKGGSGGDDVGNGLTPFEVSHGTDLLIDLSGQCYGLTVKDGDLVRIQFSIRVMTQDDYDYVSALDFTSGLGAAVTCDSIGLIFYPMWDLGTGTFSMLPGRQPALNTDASGSSTVSFQIDSTDGMLSDGVAFCSLEGAKNGTTDQRLKRTVHASANYIHTGSDITISRIRLNGRGPVTYHSLAGNDFISVPDWTGAPYSGNFSAPIYYELERGQLMVMVMRQGA